MPTKKQTSRVRGIIKALKKLTPAEKALLAGTLGLTAVAGPVGFAVGTSALAILKTTKTETTKKKRTKTKIKRKTKRKKKR